MKFEKSLGYVFLQTSNNYRNALEKTMNEIDLHYGQIAVLSMLWDKDARSQIALAKGLKVSQVTINKMVKSLAQKNFVSCRQCENDGRKMRVYLTVKGRETEQRVVEKTNLLQTEFFLSLTETEQLIFKQLCDKLGESNSRSKSGE